MRIAIYHNLSSGGAKRALCELARQLGSRHTLDAYSLSSADHSFADLRPFVRRHQVFDFTPSPALPSPWGRLNQAMRLNDLYRLRRINRRVAQEIERIGYDLVFVHGCQFEKAPSLLQYITRLPTVYFCQESLRHLYEPMPARPYESRSSVRALLDRIDPLPTLYHHALRVFDRNNLQKSDRVLVNTEFSRREIERIYQVPAHVSYLGVDIDRFRPLSAGQGDYLLSVGSLTPLKGFDFLIAALAELPAAERVPLVIASNFQNAPERAYLQQLADAAGVKLVLRDNISDDELVKLYNEARLTLYAPIREPFGLVAIESMACGTPVVGVGEGGIRETVHHEVTGLLAPRDPAAFSASVRQLMHDPARADQFGAQGRQAVLDKWTWPHAAARLEDHLVQVVDAPKNPLASLGNNDFSVTRT